MIRMFDDDTEKEIAQDYQRPGATMQSVGMLYGCSESTVRGIIDRCGVARKPPGTRPRISRNVRMLRLYLDGRSVTELSAVYNLSPQRVCAILNDLRPDRVRMSGNRYWRTI